MRTVRSCPLLWSISSRRWIGAENCTRVLRPSTMMLSKRRRRPVTAQLSANKSFHGLDSLSGDWPQNTLTGMICASSAAFWLRALTRRVKVGGAPRLSWRPIQSGSGVR